MIEQVALNNDDRPTSTDSEWLWKLPAKEDDQETKSDRYPRDTFGLAISGGGIRSSTFALGVLQAMARRDLLRRIDLLSTVSGGGYVGTFLGRYFDQLRRSLDPNAQGQHAAHKVVAQSLSDSRSTPLRWLREHANYMASSGSNEQLFNLATFWRNFLSLHFVLGTLFFAIFGLMNAVLYWNGIADAIHSPRPFLQSFAPIATVVSQQPASAWWILTEVVAWYFVLPIALGYWLVSQDQQGRVVLPVLSIYGLLAVAATLALQNALPLGVFMATLLAVVWVARSVERQIGSANPNSDHRRLLARHELTQNLGIATAAIAVLVVLGLINVIGQYLAGALLRGELSWNMFVARVGLLVVPFFAAAPVVRGLAGFVVTRELTSPSLLDHIAKIPYLLTGIVVLLGTILPLSVVAFFSHAAYGNGGNYEGGLLATGLAGIVSLLLGRSSARQFVNRSGPLAVYASRLSRVFLGAVNPVRHRGSYSSDVASLIEGDDVIHDDYQPHLAGGPLHLFNVTVNETVDVVSQRGQRDRQGENMAVGPVGLNIARRSHARWGMVHRGRITVEPILNGADMHPFVHRLGRAVRVERLSIRYWMAVSGAAVSAGAGRLTGPAFSLLVTLGNFRLGYWWDSGLWSTQRANNPIRLNLAERVKRWGMRLLTTQALLTGELRGRFPGPWRRYIYLSDGGHFENSGAYELLRRRIPLVMVIDGGQDRKAQSTGLGELARTARVDFGCEFEPADAAAIASLGVPQSAASVLGSPADLLHPAGGVANRHASLIKVTYRKWPGPGPDPWNGRETTWMLYVRLTYTGDEPIDVVSYRAHHPDFPNESTLDQNFDEPQFESYRCLGQHIGDQLFSGT